MTRPCCEFGQWDRPRGCRKRARWAVEFMSFFGRRIGMKGDEDCYVPSVTLRCDDHRAVERAFAETPAEDYVRVCEAAR